MRPRVQALKQIREEEQLLQGFRMEQARVLQHPWKITEILSLIGMSAYSSTVMKSIAYMIKLTILHALIS